MHEKQGEAKINSVPKTVFFASCRGASPEFLRRHCGKLAFSNLLCKPTDPSVEPGLLGRVLKAIPFLSRALIGRIAMHEGAYSSTSIEKWVDEKIYELLPNALCPVKFNAMFLPIIIVATDLVGGRSKVWSTTTTPDDSVAFAVRCSCSIPLFFESVGIGNNRFVDGGLLSNLLAFVFTG